MPPGPSVRLGRHRGAKKARFRPTQGIGPSVSFAKNLPDSLQSLVIAVQSRLRFSQSFLITV